MSDVRVGSNGAKSIGWENEGGVKRGNDAIVRQGFAAARASGQVTLTPLKDFEVVALEAKLKSGTKTSGDRSVDLGDGERLIQRDGRVYLRAGDQYSSVTGYTFPPLRMASPVRRNG